MKLLSKENPSIIEAHKIIETGLKKRAMITIFGSCNAKYEGRAKSELKDGERIILLKPDGSFIIHQNHKLDPINWQPPKSKSKVKLRNNKLFLKSIRRSPEEYLTVELLDIHLVTYYLPIDSEDLEQTGHEKDMGIMICKNPEIIEKGFRPTDTEHQVPSGFIDILGKDKNGTLMILELKSRKAGMNAVKQLRRYVQDYNQDKEKIRGILVAPNITNDAQEILEAEGLEFKSVKPPQELKISKKVTLDSFN